MLSILTALVTSGLACAGGDPADRIDPLLWVDRDFEATHVALRLRGNEAQLFVAEGRVVTQWFEAKLDEHVRVEVIGWIREAKLEGLANAYLEPPPDPEAPPLIRETDQIVLRWLDDEKPRHSYIVHRDFAPESAVALVERLENLVRSQGTRPSGAAEQSHRACVARLLDGPARPGGRSLAQMLRRSGVVFSPSRAEALPQGSALRRCLEAPGWLFPEAASSASAEPLRYVEWMGLPLELQRLEIALVPTEDRTRNGGSQ